MNVSLILLISTAIFISWMIGANSVSTTFGPVAGTKAGGVLRGAFLAGIFGLIGALVQGDSVAGTIGSGLLESMSISSNQGSIVLAVAAVLVVMGVVFHIPIPLAFTVVGGVLGVGKGVGAAWNVGKVQLITAMWVIIPFLAIFLSYIFARVLRTYVSKEGSEDFLSSLVFVIGAFCAYTAGANLVGLAVGPLLNNIDLSSWIFLLFGGMFILLGAWIGGPRIVNAVSKDYSALGVRRSICALATATVIAQTATFFGAPVSFNEVIIASMVGSGFVGGTGDIQLEKIGKTVASWISTFFASLSVTWIVASLLLG